MCLIIESNCKYAYELRMACAVKQSANNPCSVSPVKCDLCENSIVWSYGFELHYLRTHEGLTRPIC